MVVGMEHHPYGIWRLGYRATQDLFETGNSRRFIGDALRPEIKMAPQTRPLDVRSLCHLASHTLAGLCGRTVALMATDPIWFYSGSVTESEEYHA